MATNNPAFMSVGGPTGTGVFFNQDLAREFNALGAQFRQETGRQFPINLAEFVSNPQAVREMIPQLKLRAINPQLSDAALNALPREQRAARQRELFGLAAGGLQLAPEVIAARGQRQTAQQQNAQQAQAALLARQNQFTNTTQPLLALAQAAARIEPGRITTPQFNPDTGSNNFAQFAAGNQTGSIPTTGVLPQPGDSPFPAAPSAPRPAGIQGRQGPSQQELVSTVQSGLRLGRQRKSAF